MISKTKWIFTSKRLPN